MAKVYYRLIKAGTWQIDQVPAIWKDAVQELLDQDSQ